MRLIEWSFATFHTCFFFALLILPVYLTGSLGRLLASLNTMVGTLIFLLFWLATWWCTRRALRAILAGGPASVFEITSGQIAKAFYLAPLWGGINGVIFLLSLFGIGAVTLLLFVIASPSTSDFLSTALAGVAVLPFAAAVAFVTGAVVGLLFTILDGILFAAAQSVAKRIVPDLPIGEDADGPDDTR